jgi:hypothetical protein
MSRLAEALINESAAWLQSSDVPKLFVNAGPGRF